MRAIATSCSLRSRRASSNFTVRTLEGKEPIQVQRSSDLAGQSAQRTNSSVLCRTLIDQHIHTPATRTHATTLSPEDKYWKGISSDAKDLVSKMLTRQPDDRPSAQVQQYIRVPT